jgi:hypothetical protein
MASYRLNLNQQANGDYEVHEAGRKYYPYVINLLIFVLISDLTFKILSILV